MSAALTIVELATAVRGIVGDGYHVELIGRHVTTTEQEAASALRYTLQIGPQFLGRRQMRYLLREDCYTDTEVLDAAREFADRWGELPAVRCECKKAPCTRPAETESVRPTPQSPDFEAMAKFGWPK